MRSPQRRSGAHRLPAALNGWRLAAPAPSGATFAFAPPRPAATWRTAADIACDICTPTVTLIALSDCAEVAPVRGHLHGHRRPAKADLTASLVRIHGGLRSRLLIVQDKSHAPETCFHIGNLTISSKLGSDGVWVYRVPDTANPNPSALRGRCFFHGRRPPWRGGSPVPEWCPAAGSARPRARYAPWLWALRRPWPPALTTVSLVHRFHVASFCRNLHRHWRPTETDFLALFLSLDRPLSASLVFIKDKCHTTEASLHFLNVAIDFKVGTDLVCIHRIANAADPQPPASHSELQMFLFRIVPRVNWLTRPHV